MSFNFIVTDQNITINMAMLQELVQDNTAAVKPFIELFLTNVPPEIDKLLLLNQKNDWENLAKTAHHIKSSLSVIQVDDMYLMAQMIEQKAKLKQESETIKVLLEIMQQKVKTAQFILQKQLALL
jgi:HPt (histidine-containing phosphotransfer) domain-containing protein